MNHSLARNTLAVLPTAFSLVFPFALSAHTTAHRGYASVLASLGRTA